MLCVKRLYLTYRENFFSVLLLKETPWSAASLNSLLPGSGAPGSAASWQPLARRPRGPRQPDCPGPWRAPAQVPASLEARSSPPGGWDRRRPWSCLSGARYRRGAGGFRSAEPPGPGRRALPLGSLCWPLPPPGPCMGPPLRALRAHLAVADGQRERGGQGGVLLPALRHLQQPHRPGRQARQ